MSDIRITRSKIPLWSGSQGAFVIAADVPDVNAPLAPGANPLVSARFDADGGKDIALGVGDSVKIGVKTGAAAALLPLWKGQATPAADLVKRYELDESLRDDNLLLALQVGAGASLSAEGSYHYGVLDAGATLAAGADAAFVQVRPYPRNTGLRAMVEDFFGHVTLPELMTRPPGPGELVAFEFGGYLRFGASASAGYEIKGTHSADLGKIQLSERYRLAVVGKLGLQAQVAGRHEVMVRPGERPGWARVVVRRARSKEMQFAADVSVGAKVDTEGLPESGQEFLGALLGVEAKNWLNLIDGAVDAAGQLASPEALKARLDGLAQDFIAEWLGQGIDALMTPGGAALLAKVQKAAQSYRDLDGSAIALFDRFYDPVSRSAGALAEHLEHLKALTSWDQLEGEIDPLLWNVLRQLTDGDPLGWALGRVPETGVDSLTELERRASQALDLIRAEAHRDIRELIHAAKEHFALDSLLNQLGSIASPEALKALAGSKLAHFVTRLSGSAIDQALSAAEAKRVFEVVNEVAAAKDGFWKKFDHILEEAAGQSFELGVHAAYRRAEESEALIDVEVKLLAEDGQPDRDGQLMMKAAGRGDFGEVLAKYRPDLVRLNRGVLTHSLTRQTTLRINVVGWHRGFQYESAHRVIVNTEQQIRSSDAGTLTVFTTVDMRTESDERRRRAHEERVQTQFLLRFLGETSGIISGSKFDDHDRQYMIEVITGRSASYDLTFTDERTTRAELDDYLRFAADLGLAAVGATASALAPILEFKDGSFGKIGGQYAVRFTEEGIVALLGKTVTDAEIRRILRRIIVGNYARAGAIASVGWLFSSDDARGLYEASGPNFINADSVLGDALAQGRIGIASPIPGLRPGRIENRRDIRIFAAGLFDLQRELIRAFRDLQVVLTPGTRIAVAELERKLAHFGRALDMFDARDMGSHSVFAVFDGLIQLDTPAASARSSSLTLKTMREGRERTAVFVLQAA
jgi:hypothetical protein